MKKIIPLLLMAFIALACQKNNMVIVSGKITNPVDEPVRIKINYFDKIDTVTVHSDGTFYTEFELDKEHMGEFYYLNYMFPIYLEQGGNIHLEFDTNELKNKTIQGVNFSGSKSENTEFLNSVDFKWRSFNWQEKLKLPPDSFIQFTSNVQNETMDELQEFKKNNSPSQEFVQIAKLRYDVMLVFRIEYYKRMTQQNNTIILTDFLTELTEEIPLDDEEKCKEIEVYKYYLIQYYFDNINKIMNASGLNYKTSAYINMEADEIIAMKAPQVVKDEIGVKCFSLFYKRPDSLRKVYRARYKDVVKNAKYIEEFEKLADVRDKLNAGNIAPAFNYPDVNGKLISSESLKGKVIYIDVWATTCGPCKDEIPYLKKLQNELREEKIAFVSISIDREEDKKAWENMVKEKELGGYQLYADGDWNSKIAKDYVIKGIPYFIIIDKEGKLVEVFATRPSNPETKEKLLKLTQS